MRNLIIVTLAAAVSCAACLFDAKAQDVAAQTAPDKSGYHLFNPVPRETMRDLAPDRPDATESPYTVDAGHVQIEASLVDFSREGDNETLTLGAMNLKIGLLNNVDVQFVFDSYVDDEESQGFGNSQVRLKLNLWGNDEGSTAFGIMPFIQFPTGHDTLSNDHVEGGLILPLAVALPNEFSLGLMAEIDVVRNEDNDGYVFDFIHTATVARQIVGPLSGFVEYIGAAGEEQSYRAALQTGLVYEINRDLLLDGGVAAGLNDHADDFNAFLGFTMRL